MVLEVTGSSLSESGTNRSFSASCGPQSGNPEIPVAVLEKPPVAGFVRFRDRPSVSALIGTRRRDRGRAPVAAAGAAELVGSPRADNVDEDATAADALVGAGVAAEGTLQPQGHAPLVDYDAGAPASPAARR
jgi:hypothetical protein